MTYVSSSLFGRRQEQANAGNNLPNDSKRRAAVTRKLIALLGSAFLVRAYALQPAGLLSAQASISTMCGLPSSFKRKQKGPGSHGTTFGKGGGVIDRGRRVAGSLALLRSWCLKSRSLQGGSAMYEDNKKIACNRRLRDSGDVLEINRPWRSRRCCLGHC